jgi:hypothetical protein
MVMVDCWQNVAKADLGLPLPLWVLKGILMETRKPLLSLPVTALIRVT